MNRRYLGLGAISVAALLLAGCAGPGATGEEESGSTDPINLAIVYGITGAYAGTGGTYMKGFDAAVADVNANGGAAGRQVEVNLIDDKSDPTFAVSALTELLESGEGADVIVPGGVSTEALALLPLTTEYELFSVSPASSPLVNDPSSYPYHFGVSSLQSHQLASLGPTMKSEGVKNLAIMVGADAFGDTNLAGMEAVAKDNGIKIVATERPDPAALNFDVEFQRLLAADPDGIYVDFASFDAIGRAFQSRLTAGATKIPYFPGTATASSVPSTLADPAALTNCVLPVFSAMVTQDEPPAYITPLLDAFKDSEVSAYSGALGFDSVRLLDLAIDRTEGDLDAQALTDALLAEPIPADYLSLFPKGFEFSDDNHFPTPADGTFTTVPCDSSQADGLWVTD